MEFEIRQTKEWLEEPLNPFFNGVSVGVKNATELKKKHINFCEQLLAILDKEE